MELYPFKCNRCTRAFGRGTDLKEHLEDAHNAVDQATIFTAAGFLGCSDCDTVNTCVECHRKRLWQRGKKRAAAK